MAKVRKSTVPTSETKAEKSVRLGNKRVGSAVKYLRLVGNLSTNGYEFSPLQKTRIVKMVKDAAADVERRFSGDTSKGQGFDLAEPTEDAE